jgi:hypothetical protein
MKTLVLIISQYQNQTIPLNSKAYIDGYVTSSDKTLAVVIYNQTIELVPIYCLKPIGTLNLIDNIN